MSWYLNLSVSLRAKLDVLQRKMARFVLGVGPRSHIGQGTLRELGWLTIRDRARYFALLHVFRVKNGCGPGYLRKGFVPLKDVHDHKTRGSCAGFHILANDVVSTFEYFGKKEWNALPDTFKSLKNINAFKTGLKESFLESYS